MTSSAVSRTREEERIDRYQLLRITDVVLQGVNQQTGALDDEIGVQRFASGNLSCSQVPQILLLLSNPRTHDGSKRADHRSGNSGEGGEHSRGQRCTSDDTHRMASTLQPVGLVEFSVILSLPRHTNELAKPLAVQSTWRLQGRKFLALPLSLT